MTALRIVITPTLVGPKEGLADRETWTFAFSTSAGFAAEPELEEAADWAEALMPWKLYGKVDLKVRPVVVHSDGTIELLDLVGAFRSQDAIDIHDDPFIAQLRTEFVAHHRPDSAGTVAYKFTWDHGNPDQENKIEVPEEASVAPMQVQELNYPPLVQTLATLPAPLAQALQAIHYVEIPRASLGKFDSNGDWKFAARLALLPAEAVDSRSGNNTGSKLDTDPSAIADLGGVIHGTYQPGPMDGYCLGLDVKALATKSDRSYSLEYWLQVSDSSANPLADSELVVQRLCHPAYHFERTSIDEIRTRLVVSPTPVNERQASLEDVNRFVGLVRAWLASLGDDGLASLSRKVANGVFSALAGGQTKSVKAVLVEALVNAGVEGWTALADGAGKLSERNGVALTYRFNPDLKAIESRVAPELEPKPPTDARPGLPGEGIAFCVGDKDYRLVHEDNTDLASSDHGMAEVAGIGILIRRSPSARTPNPWRLVTSGVAVLGLGPEPFDDEVADNYAWLPAILPAPLTVGYVNSMIRNDYVYRGAPMRSRDALDSAHAFSGQNDHRPNFDAALDLSLESAGGLQALNSDAAARVAAPLLRYGDQYEIAAFVVDRAGGYPEALADPRGVGFKLSALDKLQPPPGTAKIQFLRTVPVGSINLLPYDPRVATDSESVARWPLIPEGVVLRSRELFEAERRVTLLATRPKKQGVGDQPLPPSGDVPALMVSSGNERGLGDSVTVWLDAPRVDEHTLMRWGAPGLDLSQDKREEGKARLGKAVKRLFKTRVERNAAASEPNGKLPVDAAGLPHDPAVRAVMVGGYWFDSVDTRHELSARPLFIALRERAGFEFEYEPVQLKVVSSTKGECTLSADEDKGIITLTLGRGTCVILDLAPAVGDDDYKQRFNTHALRELVASEVVESTQGATKGQRFCAFQANHILLEHPTADLPDLEAVFNAFMLEEMDGKVSARLKGTPDSLCFVDRFTIERTRWLWRNRPLLGDDECIAEITEEERGRRLASGFPRELGDPAKRDSSPSVAEFDEIAALDRGFAARADTSGSYPRGTDGKVLADARLLVDDHDGVLAGEYLRYRLTLHSRYAPLYGPRGRDTHWDQRWRRILTPFLGNRERIKSPAVLSVLPLTSHVGPLADDTAGHATPHLVVLNETWFREYGVGERLEARLSLEQRDIGETDFDPRPYRVGALPDHYVPVALQTPAYDESRYYSRKLHTEAEDEMNPVVLDTFGPFGFSVDRSGNEAFAGASAFIVYPPADVGPHWAMFVRFHRVLDWPNTFTRGPGSDAYPIYTLPGNDRLAVLPKKTVNPTPEKRPALVLFDDGETQLRDGLALNLDPVDGSAQNGQLARENYVYVMLISEVARDGGRGVEVELPVGLVWLYHGDRPLRWDPSNSYQFDDEAAYRARVIELLLNGLNADPLKDQLRFAARNLQSFWRLLLPNNSDASPQRGPECDAIATVRRVSSYFLLIKGRSSNHAQVDDDRRSGDDLHR